MVLVGSYLGGMSTTSEHPPPGPDEHPEPGPVRGVGLGDTAEALGDSVDGPGGAGTHPVLVAAHDCLVALRSCQDASMLTLTAEQVKVLILAVTQIIAQAIALRLRLLVAGDANNVADTTGATSTASFLAHLTQTVRAKAGEQVRIGHDLDRRYQLLGAAFSQGRLNYEQVKVCVAALRKLPKDLPADALEACQAFLIDAAQDHDAKALKHQAGKLWWIIDPQGAEAKQGQDLEDEEERARAKAYFTSWRNGDGTTGFRGKLPDAQFDILNKLIQAYAAPRRSHLHRKNGRPQPEDGAPETSGTAPCDQPAAQPHPAETTTGKKLSWPAIQGLGLIDLIEHIPAEAVPFTGGMPASILVLIDLDNLISGLGTATLDTGTVISAAQARRMGCTAGLIPIVLDGKSQPLDVGQEQRFHTRYHRAAALARAHRQNPEQAPGCCVEGCDRPAGWLVAHHPIPFAQGGDTSVENCALPCDYHHTLLHSTAWTTTWLPNGKARLHKTRRTRN